MANTLFVRMEATVLDAMNVQAETSAYALVDPTASFDDILTTMNTWLADLDACTDGQIIAAELEVLPLLPGGLKASPVSGSRVEQVGILQFTATGNTHVWSTAIPALASAQVVAGKPVTTEGSPLDVLADLLESGGTAVLTWTNNVSQALLVAVSALLSFRRSGRDLARDTYERA